MKEALILLTVALLATLDSGCHSSVIREPYGKTFYLDGSGNWGWGSSGVARGLPEGGYEGDIEVFVWTTSFIPGFSSYRSSSGHPI